MARITIIEDGLQDLIKRYGDLNGRYNVSVELFNSGSWFEGRKLKSYVEELLREGGFDVSKVVPGSLSSQAIRRAANIPLVPEADFYFLDGLGGDYSIFIETQGLPRGNCYIYSDSERIIEEAEEAGFKVVRDGASLKDIVQQK